mmetsp:Transcript_62988/g.119115  ORF Transcript_62988/g.119115 Transcript_62988/m.119115 type:complete len:206 (-) Transcript_62988:606-1223(-)
MPARRKRLEDAIVEEGEQAPLQPTSRQVLSVLSKMVMETLPVRVSAPAQMGLPASKGSHHLPLVPAFEGSPQLPLAPGLVPVPPLSYEGALCWEALLAAGLWRNTRSRWHAKTARALQPQILVRMQWSVAPQDLPRRLPCLLRQTRLKRLSPAKPRWKLPRQSLLEGVHSSARRGDVPLWEEARSRCERRTRSLLTRCLSQDQQS